MHKVIANVIMYLSLAWAEMRLAFAHVYRKFNLVPVTSLYVS